MNQHAVNATSTDLKLAVVTAALGLCIQRLRTLVPGRAGVGAVVVVVVVGPAAARQCRPLQRARGDHGHKHRADQHRR